MLTDSRRGRVAAAAGVLLGWACCVGARSSPAFRLATVRDGIEMVELADPMYLSGSPACGFPDSASFSPNGRQFVVVVRRGDVERNRNIYTMLLWGTKDIGTEQPKAILRLGSSSTNPAIDPSTISWVDSHSLTFLGEQPGGRHEVFLVNLTTGKLRILTRHRTDIVTYSRDARGATIAYEALPPVESLWDATTSRTGLVVTSQWPQDIVMGMKQGMAARILERRLFIRDQNGTREIQPLPGSMFYGDSGGRSVHELSISPDGRHIVVVERVPVSDIPNAWHEYRDWGVAYGLTHRLQGRETESELSRYVLVDSESGVSRVLRW